MDILTASTLAVLTIYGPARVIDGDTVVVNQTHVRLKGVDAAEMNTNLGKHSKQVMISIVGTGNKLTCYLTGEKTYKRDVGYCFTEAHVDINQEIIARGAALACPRYDTRYVEFETEAAIANQQRARYCGTPARRTKSIPAATPIAPEPPPATSTPKPPEPTTPPATTTSKPDGSDAGWVIGLAVIVAYLMFRKRMIHHMAGVPMPRYRRSSWGRAFMYGMIRGLGRRW